MNVIDHARAQLDYNDAWGDITDLDVAYGRSTDPRERDELAGRIADLYERCAALLEGSGFVRWWSQGLSATPESLRATAQHWRLYGDPEDDNR